MVLDLPLGTTSFQYTGATEMKEDKDNENSMLANNLLKK